MKSFPIDVHILSLGIIHRLLIYQKRTKCRLNYDWRSLWETLIHLLRWVFFFYNCNFFRHPKRSTFYKNRSTFFGKKSTFINVTYSDLLVQMKIRFWDNFHPKNWTKWSYLHWLSWMSLLHTVILFYRQLRNMTNFITNW